MKMTIQMVLALLLILATACKKREKRESKYDNGQIKEQFEVTTGENNSFVKDGLYTAFYSNGQKQFEVHYENNKREGILQEWSDNGKIHSVSHFKNDLWHGERKVHMENGFGVVNYENGVAEGAFEIFQNDKKIVSGRSKAGNSDGLWTLNNEEGIKIAHVEMENGVYKTPVQNVAPTGTGTGCATFSTFSLNKSTYAEVKLGFLEQNFVPGTINGTNKYTNGKMITIFDEESSLALGKEKIKKATFIFDEKDILTAILLTLPKGGFQSSFKSVRNELATNYKLVNEVIPFVGSCSALFSDGDCTIEVNAPHLDFEMVVAYRTKTFRDLLKN